MVELMTICKMLFRVLLVIGLLSQTQFVSGQINFPSCSSYEKVVNANNVGFFLFTKANPSGEKLEIGVPESVTRSSFDGNEDVIIYIHGFSDVTEGDGATTIRDEYLVHSKWYNVILVNWCAVASDNATLGHQYEECITPNGLCQSNFLEPDPEPCDIYFGPACNVVPVGNHVADFLKFLTTAHTSENKIHLIGHSLGAHIAGIAAQNLKTDSGKIISRITGLDPSSPLFNLAAESKRLDSGDAAFVDVIHTAGRDLPVASPSATTALGQLDPVGHIDFYPNRGKPFQPGCDAVDKTEICSQARSWRFYAESINNNATYPSCPCTNWMECNIDLDSCTGVNNFMGHSATLLNAADKYYYVSTHQTAPFGKGIRAECEEVSETLFDEADTSFLTVTSPLNVAGTVITKLLYDVRFNTSSRLPMMSATVVDSSNDKIASNPSVHWRPTSCLLEEQQPYCKIGSDYGLGEENKTLDFAPVNKRDRSLVSHVHGNRHSQEARDKMYYCINSALQDEYTRQCIWGQVEKDANTLAKMSQGAYIFSGTCKDILPNSNGDSSFPLRAPSCLWKFVCRKTSSGVEAGGWVVRNEQTPLTHNSPDDVKCRQMQTSMNVLSIDEIKSQTGVSDEEIIEMLAMRLEKFDTLKYGAQCMPWANPLPLPNLRAGDLYENCDCTKKTDATLEPGAIGRDTVYAVDRLIQKANIFPQDYQFHFRAANAKTEFGNASDTFRDGFYGGIWAVTEAVYLQTKTNLNPSIRTKIQEAFGIYWPNTKWTDLLKPLYSGLAARIWYHNQLGKIDMTIRKQSLQFQNLYPGGPTAIYFETVTRAYYEDYPSRGQYDMAIILDGSGSIQPSDFALAKQAVGSILSTSKSGSPLTRQGIILFSDDSREQLTFLQSETMNPTAINNSALSMVQPRSGTNTHLGLRMARNLFQRQSNQTNPWVSIVLTDGQSNDNAETIRAARESNAAGIVTYSIGIGSINQAELLAIADNDPSRVLLLTNFEDLLELHFWLNVEYETIPIQPNFNETDSGILVKDEVRYYKFPMPSHGITFNISCTEGAVRAFYSYNYQTPSAALNDGEISNGFGFISQSSSRSSGVDTLYLAILGVEDINRVDVQNFEGRREPCGFIGIGNEDILADAALENTAAGTILWRGKMYGYGGSFEKNTLYIQQSVEGNTFMLVAKQRFSQFVKETRNSSITTAIGFGCPGGTRKNYKIKIPVLDKNDEGPAFESMENDIRLTSPVDLDTPFAKLTVRDDDVKEGNAVIAVVSDNPIVRVSTTPMWERDGSVPDVYRYQVQLYFKETPPVGVTTFKVISDDGVFRAEAAITVTVV